MLTLSHVAGPRDNFIEKSYYYVATQLKDVDSYPPVARCGHENIHDRGGFAFIWQPKILVAVKMNHKHCTDWPEIYQEFIRVLQLVRKV